MNLPPRIRSVEALVYRQPIAQPVVTSFGLMADRPAVFVRIEDSAGQVGFGEVWCNFPSVGPEYRARLVNQVVGPAVVGDACEDPRVVFEKLSRETAVLALQCGEQGPFSQAIAGIDIALWDLAGQRAGVPLWKLLGGQSPTVPVYASGIDPDNSLAVVVRQLNAGHRAFKVKVGFGCEKDIQNLRTIRNLIGNDLALCADANQAWSLEEALEMIGHLKPFNLTCHEEPLRADRPWSEWQQVAAASSIPIAAGENLSGMSNFRAAVGVGQLSYVQPDIAKWGGISACFAVACEVVRSGRTYCPHFLGGGIGLLASAHLLSAVGGNGWLEIDSNENQLRDALCGPISNVVDGHITLDNNPGLGTKPDLRRFDRVRSSI